MSVKSLIEQIHQLRESRKSVSREQAQELYDEMKLTCDFDQFFMGMNIELEHQDVTHGNLHTTAKIALAHLKEKPNYYTKLKKSVE